MTLYSRYEAVGDLMSSRSLSRYKDELKVTVKDRFRLNMAFIYPRLCL